MKYFENLPQLKYIFDLKYKLTVISTVACSEEMFHPGFAKE